MTTEVDPTAQKKVVVYEPPYFKTMPWVLIAAALGLTALTLIVRTELHKTSVVVVQSRLPAETTSTTPAENHDHHSWSSGTAEDHDHHSWSSGTAENHDHHSWSSGTAENHDHHSWSSGTATHSATQTATVSQPATTPTAANTGSTNTSSTNTSSSKTGSTNTSSAKTDPTVEVKADALPPEKKTTTEAPPSDTVVTTLLGFAATLFVLGAFFTRISKVTIAGNTVELGVPKAIREQDDKAVTEKVNRRIPAQLQAAAGEGDAVSTEDAQRIAQLSADARARLQRETALLRATASAATAVAGPATAITLQPEKATAITVKPDEMKALGSGMPLPDGLLDRLADRAFEDLENDPS